MVLNYPGLPGTSEKPRSVPENRTCSDRVYPCNGGKVLLGIEHVIE